MFHMRLHRTGTTPVQLLNFWQMMMFFRVRQGDSAHWVAQLLLRVAQSVPFFPTQARRPHWKPSGFYKYTSTKARTEFEVHLYAVI